MTDLFTMPIIATKESVTWRPTEADRLTAIKNHSQTLETLKARGGVDWSELDAIVLNEPYGTMRYSMLFEDLRRRVHMVLRERAHSQ